MIENKSGLNACALTEAQIEDVNGGSSLPARFNPSDTFAVDTVTGASVTSGLFEDIILPEGSEADTMKARSLK